MIKAIFFDLGGVLVNDLFPLMESYLSGISGKPYPLVREVRKQYWLDYELGRMDGVKFFQLQIDDLGVDLNAEEVLAKSIEVLKTRPEVVEIVRMIRATGKYTLGVLSNNTDEWFEHTKNELGLGDLFDVWVCSSHHHVKKPDAEIYRIAAEQAGLPTQNCLFIDNRQHNIDGAKAAGMKGIVYTCPEKLRSELKRLGVEL